MKISKLSIRHKHSFIGGCLLLIFACCSCVNDDKYSWDEDFADRTSTDTIKIQIAYIGSNVTISGDENGYVSTNGADVTVKSSSNRFLQLELTGATENGSLTIYSWKKIGVLLNGVSITNPNGPAINNQCGKAFYVTMADGTSNTLTDGEAYDSKIILSSGDTIDQKATLFSEGQIYFQGNGSLTVNGNARNGIASDDYIVFENGKVNVNVSENGTNGIKVNDGFTMMNGTLNINVKADGARGIRNESLTTILDGNITIITSGDCLLETICAADGTMSVDTTSCAGIKGDDVFTMNGGTLTITSSGDGGKGINCDKDICLNGGTMIVKTTGGNDVGKPKAVKSETGIILSGGSFTATCKKSWACDNGVESDDPADRVTIIGTPTTKSLTKKEMIVVF